MAGIYIHIPFCKSKCAYCDFYSIKYNDSISDYIVAVIDEARLRSHEIDEVFDTMYLGGGTPSILKPELLGTMVRGVLSELHSDVTTLKEFTIEVNPEDITPDLVKQYIDIGINRISMGVQSFVDSELKYIGRRHNAEKAIEAINIIDNCGIKNYSIDLIYGLPGQDIDSWKHSVSKLFELSPPHFSSYLLSYEPRTRLNALLKKGFIKETDEETIGLMYNHLTEEASRNGYVHYEISNFAKPGKEALHNSSYWNYSPYIGLGPGAHSFDGDVRRVNNPDLKSYISSLNTSKTYFEIEEETKDNKFNDLIVVSLRTARGLDFANVQRRRRRQFLCDAYKHLCVGNLCTDGTKFYIPEYRWLIADNIMRDLMQ